MEKNNLQKENSIANNIYNEKIYFEIVYKPKKDKKDKTKIFGNGFINKNKDKCKIIYENKEYELKEYFDDIDNNIKNKEEISFILRINKNITDISYMFYKCDELYLIRDKSKINYYNDNASIFDIKNEFNLSNENRQNEEIFNQNSENNLYKYCKDYQIPSSKSTISNKNNSSNFISNNKNDKENILILSKFNNFHNVINMSYMFYYCESLISVPDLSKWNISNVKDMSWMFNGCKSLISLPDISKWNTFKVNNMSRMFNGCNFLISLPDISKWNTSKFNDMSGMLIQCFNCLNISSKFLSSQYYE